MKTKIFLLLTILLLYILPIFSVCYSQQDYNIVSKIPTETLASNTLYEWEVIVYFSGTTTPVVGTYTTFVFSWLSEPKYALTDAQGIAVITDVKTPSISEGKTQTITISAGTASIEVTINIDVGIFPKLEYYSQQFYDPTTKEGLTFYVNTIDTEYLAPLKPDTLSATAKHQSGTTFTGVPTEESVGKYKLIFFTDLTGTYEVSVSLLKQGYVSMTEEVTVMLGKPRLTVKVNIVGEESWVGYEPSYTEKVTSELIVDKHQYQIDVYIYNTKGYEVPVYFHEIDFIIHGMVSGNVYSLHYENTAGALPLYAEPVGEEPTSHWRILFELTEISYDLNVKIDKGVVYWQFDETLKLSTLGRSPDWLTFLYHPWFILAVVVITVYLILTIKKRKKNE